MKTQTIEVTYTMNLGNYESARIGGTFEVEPGESGAESIIKAFGDLKKTAEIIRRLHLSPEGGAAKMATNSKTTTAPVTDSKTSIL